MTTEQARSLLEAWPKRVPYFTGEQIIQCTACRQYFATGKAWKAHRRNWSCDTSRLIENALGIWTTTRRIRVNQPNEGTTSSDNTVTDAPESDLLITPLKRRAS